MRITSKNKKREMKTGSKIIVVLLAFCAVVASWCFSIIQPNELGVKKTLGELDTSVKSSGVVWHLPFITTIERVKIHMITHPFTMEAFSKDMQSVDVKATLIYSFNPEYVRDILIKYPIATANKIITDTVQEVIKQGFKISAAEELVAKREDIKESALSRAKMILGQYKIFIVHDLVIADLDFSSEFNKAIEAKVREEQEFLRATYTKNKMERLAEAEAEVAKRKAEGIRAIAQAEADAIKLKGEALKSNPNALDELVIQKWNGVLPTYTGGQNVPNLFMPVGKNKTKN